MYFLGLGIILLLMKYLEIGPVATWDWIYVLVPFGLAAAWWWFADKSGYTKRKQVEKMEGAKQDRIDKHKRAIGMKVGPRK
jgi:small Trp-rich protein